MKKTLIFVLIAAIVSTFQQQTIAQAEQSQRYLYEIGIVDSLYSNILEEQREIWVHLPDSYGPDSYNTYPVVYVLDGGVHMKGLETVYEYYRGHHLPDMILVGISNRANRTRDLTTSQIKWRNGGPVREETGGAETFTQFIESELIPYIDRKYPTTPFRTLIGHSYAGLFAINTLFNHPQLFENYIAIDPSLDWDNQKLLKQAKVDLQNKNFQGKSLFLTLAGGQLHMLNGEITIDNIMQDTSDYTLVARSIIEFSTFAENQKQSGLDFSWTYYPDDYHWTIPLPSIRDGLIAQFEWYQLKSATKYSNPDTSLEDLLDLIKNRERTLADHFGYSSPPLVEELCNQLGYMFMQFEQPQKSYTFFKMGIDYYSESANAFDSMADYYESQMDYDNALRCVSKAFEISGKVHYKKRMEDLKKK